jgi:hypothetical protein
LAQPSKSISADPNSEALMTLSMAALFISSSDRCLCGRHEALKKVSPVPPTENDEDASQKGGENVA